MSRQHNINGWLLHGLTVKSDCRFQPGPATQSCEGLEEYDVLISMGSVPDRLDAVTHERMLWQSNPSQFLFKAPGIGRFLVEAGRYIRFMPTAEIDDCRVNSFLWHDVWFALLVQRGELPFHASVVSHEGVAIALLSYEPNGKTRIAEALIQNGCKLLCDRFCVISNGQTGHQTSAKVYPGFRHLSHWSDEHDVNKQSSELQNDVCRKLIPLSADKIDTSPIPLKYAFRLRTGAHAAVYSENQTSLGNLQSWIKAGPETISNNTEDQMAHTCLVSQQVPVTRLFYDMYSHSLAEIADYILDSLQ